MSQVNISRLLCDRNSAWETSTACPASEGLSFEMVISTVTAISLKVNVWFGISQQKLHYKVMKLRKANDNMKSVVDAAALQSDFARRFNLPGAMARKSNRTAGTSSSRGTCVVSASSFHRIDIFRSPICCESCNMPYTLGSRICSSCGYFFSSGVQLLESTLAERRGLVTLPSVMRPMVECEWRVVESQLEGAETSATAQSTCLKPASSPLLQWLKSHHYVLSLELILPFTAK